ncbi:interleukin-1 receptor-associated kinase 4 isoform X1 [Ornithorhynchus anatinus]|uniref:Interleukin-1 receptor-associated kinase 4 n=3 Tax=Ornithorhynchus anatinus TaxID=9258 RepID=F7APZ3_ORNAN|nr:interleukin-1 receptor-associated kinase 4 isoform X1 [Ornithorhynchus anatinus]XP_028913866.1 interleukin-1 receptor-associated kinase 4 isoform X1 [Ornithorhynchus anatinus]
MSKTVTPSTYVRCLNFGLIRQLADFIDPQEGWKKLAVDIKKPSGESKYNQLHIRRFEGLIQMGKSPTCELLFDWGTSNCTVGDLVDLLIRNQFLAPASLLLPDAVPKTDQTFPLPSQETLPIQEKPVPPLDKEKTTTLPGMAQNHEYYSFPDSTSSDTNSVEFSDTRFHQFSFQELRSVTSNFDERPISIGGNKMGEGGFGVVYKGSISNRVVAVKKLAAMVDISTQELKQQFDQEIKTMAKCRHENLVELIGFSSDGDDLCLVYVYMPNGSLFDRLSCLDGTAPLSWHTRCDITQGIASGISFLHENHHIHRDIKSANILLDEAFVPKISDFGLARASGKFTHTMMTNRIMGTTAYMAPEALHGEITPKSDIYSFGVVLLEIITGLPAVDEQRDPQLLLNIKDEIEDEEKTIESYIDTKMNDWDSTSVENMYSIASQCLHEKKNKRPDIRKVQQLLQEMTTC